MNFRVGLRTLAASAILAFGLVRAEAATLTFLTDLSGSNEIPPNNSRGGGPAEILLDTTLNTLEVEIGFTGLSGPAAFSALYCCVSSPAAPENIGGAIPFVAFPASVSGFYSRTFDL